MPVVPLQQGQSVLPSTSAGTPYMQINAQPDDFGAQVGAAEQRVGQGAQQLGGTVMDIATQNQLLANKVAVQAAFNQHQDATTKLLYGDPNDPSKPGFLALQGQAAMNAYPAVAQALEDSRKAQMAALPNARAQLEFDETARRYNTFALTQAGSHYARETDRNAQLTFKEGIDVKANDVAHNYTDDAHFQATLADAQQAADLRTLSQGYTVDSVTGQANRLQATQTLYRARAVAIGTNDPVAGMAFVTANENKFDAITYHSLVNEFKPAALRSQATTLVDGIMGGRAPSPALTNPSGVASGDLPPEQQAFLNTIAGPESGGRYDIRYTPNGPATFSDFTQHPRVPEATTGGNTSTAAGRYQITGTTYDEFAPKLGVTGFTPRDQDRLAMGIAADTYSQKTGRDLAADLKEGGHAAEIADALKGRWPSLPGGTQQGRNVTLSSFAAGLQANAPRPMVFGDSIAQGMKAAGGLQGAAQVGAPPAAVLTSIQNTPDANVKGQNVILSSGVSNNPADVALVADQIAALKAKGAASVTLVGVGNRADLAPLNDQLATIAQQAGARFTGPLDPGSLAQDGVHPSDYRGLVAQASAQPQAAPSQPLPDIAPDKETLLRKAVEAAGDNRDLQAAAVREVDRRLALWQAATANERGTLKANIANLGPALLQGQSLPIPEADIRRLLPPSEAEPTIEQLKLQATAGDIVSAARFAGPGDRGQLLSDYTNPNGNASYLLRLKLADHGLLDPTTSPAGQPDNPGLFNLRQKLSQFVTSQLVAQQKALDADPAGYAMQEPGIHRLIAAIDPKNPASFAAYADATLGLQRSMGVPENRLSVLAANQANNIVSQLTQADPKTTDVGQQLDQLAKAYGYGGPPDQDRWSYVWHDLVNAKLPETYQVLGSMQRGPDRIELQRALQTAAEKGGLHGMETSIPQADRDAINKGVAAAIQPFMQSVMISGLQGDPNVVRQIEETTRMLAFYKVMTGSTGPDAIAKAAEATMPFDYEGSNGWARAPKGVGSAATAHAANLLGNLTPTQIASLAGGVGMRQEDKDAQTMSAIRRSGNWVTNGRGDGWELWLHNNDGSWAPVKRPDGSMFGFRFAEIPSGTQGQTPDPTMTPTGGL